MKLNKLFVILFAATFLFFIGCEKDDDKTTLNDYLVENSLDLNNMLDGWLITAYDLNENLDNYYVIDTRQESAYNTSHIPGAVWANGSTLLDVAANNGGKQIVVHCYKGIGAAPKLVALRLSGYTDAQNLKFGMSSWHSDLDSWTAACSDTAEAYPNGWVTTGDPATPVEYDYPAIATTEVDNGADYLEERVAYLLDEGFGYASATAILADPSSFYLNNYWDENAWTTYGHFPGAYRINPMSIANGGINNMNPDETIVTYCWTSQTSGVIAAYLTILGYEAQSLSKGANGMIWSRLTGHKWDSANGTPGANAPGDYALEQ